MNVPTRSGLPWLLFGLLACSPSPSGAGQGEPAPAPASPPVSPPPQAAAAPAHVFLIVIDTLRADHLGLYGHEVPTTPNIDALAGKGVVFERGYSSSSNTIESSIALFLSRQPTRGQPDPDALPPEQAPVQSLFKRAGFDTFAVVSNPWLTLYKFFQRDFDSWGSTSQWTKNATAPVFEGVERILDKGFAPGRKSFFYIHILDPHDPYAPPRDYGFHAGPAPRKVRPIHDLSGETQVRTAFHADPAYTGKPRPLEPAPGEVAWHLSQYDAELRYVDEHIGLLVARLTKLGVLDDSLIVITSDHGEEFHEHGGFKHGFTLHEEAIRVPLIFHWPAGLSPRRTELLASSVDIAPTLLSLCRLPVPERMSGRDILAEVPESRPVVLATHYVNQRQRALRTERQKIIEDVHHGTVEIYDLQADPGERRNLFTGDRKPFAALFQLFEQTLSRYPPAVDEKPLPPVVDERLRSQLEALGYLNAQERQAPAPPKKAPAGPTTTE